LVLAPTILVWLVVGSSFFGYHLVVSQGSSMEPLLRNGDALWLKQVNPSQVKVGDIVTLQHPNEGWITHRLIKVQSLPQEGYLLVTKGDANWFTEEWEISADGTVEVLLARVHFAGYVLDFFDSILGIALLIGVVVTLLAIWVHRARMARGGG